MNDKDKKLQERILSTEVLFEDPFSIFSRFIVRIKGLVQDAPIGIGCVFSNSKVVLYQPHADILATYPSLELFRAEFGEEFGYEVTFLDKSVSQINNKNIQ
jgi:hypothetical protein